MNLNCRGELFANIWQKTDRIARLFSQSGSGRLGLISAGLLILVYRPRSDVGLERIAYEDVCQRLFVTSQIVAAACSRFDGSETPKPR